MDAYETGYRAAVSRTMVSEMADHWSGRKPVTMGEDWHAGYQDAEDDITATRQGCDQMQFGPTCPR